MTSPSYPPTRVKQGPSTRPRASEPKRAGSVRRWASVFLDSVPSVSPQGEAGGDEAAAKAPRWIKHDRGQSESPQRRTRTAPVQTAAARRRSRPRKGAGLSPHPAARAIRQQRTVSGLRAVVYALGESIESDLITPTPCALNYLGTIKREPLRCVFAGKRGRKVADDLKAPGGWF